MDRKELVTILSTDMSKAFDSLCPARTIKKLEAYGFGNRSLDLRASLCKILISSFAHKMDFAHNFSIDFF